MTAMLRTGWILLLLMWTAGPLQAQQQVTLSDDGERVSVKVGDQLFTRFEYRKYSKPIFYPVRLNDSISMTRHYPMVADVEGEAKDHPHHMSVWIGHEVNGLDFWAGRTGQIRFDKLSIDTKSGTFVVQNQWLSKPADGGEPRAVVTERTTYSFGGDQESRWIDARIEFQANDGEVTFDDTKEGMFAIRTHPNLRLKPVSADGPTGSARNDSGVEGRAIWGKPARWLDYSGVIDGKPVGIAMFDHPENLRHPTTWHARDYGLVAANPFGLHHFTGVAQGKGAYRIAQGESLKLRYRVLFYHGEFDKQATERRFREFAD